MLEIIQNKPEEHENVQYGEYYAPDKATVWDKDHPHPGYPASFSGYIGVEGLGAYTREVPDRFEQGVATNDQFMNSMITNYAHEKATDTGTPTADFYMNFGAAKMGAYEVLKTHLGLEG